MKKQLTYIDDKSSKFWVIEVITNAHTVTFGKIGTSGQSKTKTFTDNAEAIHDAEKLVKAKTKKGYKEVSEEKEEKWFEKLKKRVYKVYKSGILNYSPKSYCYIQLNWTDQGYGLGLSTDPTDDFWEYQDDPEANKYDWTLEGVYRELENIPFEDDEGYRIEFEREEWPFDEDDCRNLEWFLIRVILGITFLKLEKDKDLQKHLSNIKVIDVISLESYLSTFDYHLPEKSIRQNIVNALIEKEEDKKLVLDLWADQLKNEGAKFLNTFEREISENVELVEDTFQDVYHSVLDSFAKLELFTSSETYAQKIIDTLENRLTDTLQTEEESNDLLEKSCNMIGVSYSELEDYQKAIDWYTKGLKLKSNGDSFLNLMELYATKKRDFNALIKLGEQYPQKDTDHLFNKKHYLGIAYIHIGDQEKAKSTYKQVLKIVEGDENIGKKEKVIQTLQKLSNTNTPNSEVVKEILSWFNSDNTAKNTLSDNQEWWKTVPDEIKNLLLMMNGIFNSDLNNTSNTVIEKIISIETLSISNKGLTDISFISKMTGLEYLNLDYNEITDLSPLENITGLKQLSISNNPIASLTPISKLIQLVKLDVNECEIQSLAGIEQLKKLTDLEVKENDLKDILPIANLSSLGKLNLYKNSIKDISPLENCVKLEYLNLEENKIETGVERITQLPLLSDLRLDN
ncbi:leucine-rich repeat domain-containing protein [Aquimarina macrocephali]|uniref:leucine-rich repeat domain-containing protein n=1 Tax=Aquimarina macrocephali TaxID=666563 RepID=UPI003F67F8EA